MTIDVGKVGMVPLKSVFVEERARKEMGNIEELEANLKETGLISPLAVRDLKDGTYKLLAGGRRFLVLEKNNIEEVPARIYDRDLTELEMKVIEKSENFHRKDFEYYELDQLTMEIHEMQQELHGVAGKGSRSKGWRLQDTAAMLGKKSHQSTIESIKRAKARDSFPELFQSCKNASDASKVLKRVETTVTKAHLAKQIENDKTQPTLQTFSKQFIVKDFFVGAKSIPDNYAHLVEVDPPYSIRLKDQKRKNGISVYDLDQYNEIHPNHYILGHPDPNHPWRGIRAVCQECYRFMAKDSWLIFWFGPEPWENEIYEEIVKAGFKTTRLKGVWTKSIGQSNKPDLRLGNSYETFYYAWKGRPILNKPGAINHLSEPTVPEQKKTHPTERPVELMKKLYDIFTFPGSKVVIPFLGSGNGLFAADELNMDAFGYDLSKGNKDSFLVKANERSVRE